MDLTLLLESHGGNTAGFAIPDDVVASLGAGGRPPVVVTIGSHTWRSSIARMGGRYLLGVSQDNRAAAGVTAGELLDVTIVVDDAPREVEVPDDLVLAIAEQPGRQAAWDALPYSVRKEHARTLTEAKRPETRARRLEKVLSSLDA